jgi:hypothetical protein
MAEQNANAVAITGGTITGITDLAVADGGTGASTLTGYVKGSGTTPLTASATIPSSDITGLGTIASQDANNVAITGGAINGTTVGATTPAAGTFTTITGQTEVLKGTGQNFLTYSQTFTNAAWVKQTNVTATDNATTAPDGSSTAATIVWTSASTGTGIYQVKTGLSWSGISNVKSIYIRADVAGGTVDLTDPGLTGATNTFTLTTSWQRISLAEVYQSGAAGVWIKKTASSPNTIYLWGGQLEIGTSASTYTVTTSAAIYGTPTLSFSGVAGLGLESNGSLYVSPAGTGALQAQATTSSATGGNARGANAVDWQTARNAASQVASATQSFLGGGYANSSTATTSVVIGGSGNSATAQDSFVGGGASNVASGFRSSVVGGQSNTTAGYLNFIGGGFTNSGTSASAVTTQSGTMNGTTAVTLSGSNASIKVGQYITGTSIATNTYVAAISGTSLTLSQNASGSSTSTLSFYTPHGVVVGGGNNQATGSYSFIGGGGDAGTAGNRNVASGDWSFVGGGTKNTASGVGSVVVGGGWYAAGTSYANTSSGASSFIGAGSNNSVSGQASSIVNGYGNSAVGAFAFVGGGFQNSANSYASTVVGGYYGTTRSIYAYMAFPACFNPLNSAVGASQAGLLVLAKQTTDATASVLTCDGSAASTNNQVILPNNSAYYFKGSVIANVTGAANGAAWAFEGAIMRGANAGSTVLIGTPVIDRVASTSGASAWTIALTADTSNGGLAVTVTGAASTTIRFVAKVETTEVTF